MLTDEPPPPGPITSQFYAGRDHVKINRLAERGGVDLDKARSNGERLMVVVLEALVRLDSKVDDVAEDLMEHREGAEERKQHLADMKAALEGHIAEEIPLARSNRRLAWGAIFLVGAMMMTQLGALAPTFVALLDGAVYTRLGVNAEVLGVAAMVGLAIFKIIGGVDGMANILAWLARMRKRA